MSESALAQLRAGLTTSTRVTVLSGAGISAASGVPTFRGGADSLWEHERPETLATPEAFRTDPEKVWRWYDWRRGLIAACAPNAAHQALVRLAALVRRVTIITQNVDGLHQRAGSERVVEFHGSIWTLRCTRCGRERHDERHPLNLPPRCPHCDGPERPGVVWFGEAIVGGLMQVSMDAARDCDLVRVIGTSGLVYPAAGLAGVAKQSGAVVAEFNLEVGGVSAWIDHFIPGSAAETLPRLLPEA